MILETLKQIMPRCPDEWGRALLAALPDYDINTALRQAAFIAQVAHESAQLTRVEENLNYSAEGLRKIFPKYFPSDELAAEYARKPQKIASRVYANRMGNGDEASFEGWRYRGRGPFQLTGRDNYRLCGAALGLDLLEDPDQLLMPEPGIESACWYWSGRGLNSLADINDFKTITKRINGGYIGLEDREKYYQRAMEVLTA
ncbi:MAG: glycoside hydrolase family 19 protein [Bacteroidota bacterium]